MATTELKRKRPKIGDIVEIAVPGRGVAFAHYVKQHRAPPGLGALLRILPGVYKSRLENTRELAAGPEAYLVFFPLGAACHRGLVQIVDHLLPGSRFDLWPLMRGHNENYHTGVKTWFLWEGGEWTKIGTLPVKYYDLSLVEILNLTALQERLAAGWMPRDEV